MEPRLSGSGDCARGTLPLTRSCIEDRTRHTFGYRESCAAPLPLPVDARARIVARSSRWCQGALSVALALISVVPIVQAGERTFPTPSDDRWQYPFNFQPGSRAAASVFGAAGLSGFNDRDAAFVIAWDTSAQISPGLGAEAYAIRFVRVILCNQKSAGWPVDSTADEWFTYDVNGDDQINGDGIPRGEAGDADGESDDLDPGRPIELYGAGFGPTFSAQTWRETSLYVGSDSASDLPRDPFPLAFTPDGAHALHVEDNIKGLHNEPLGIIQFSPEPWAIGVPQDYVPGEQAVPFAVEFEIDLRVGAGSVHRYFREQLDAGRVAVVVTSLTEAAFMGSSATFPSFYTKEGFGFEPGAFAPRLEVHVCTPARPDFDRDCDVDLDDLAFLNGCSTGPAIGPMSAGCTGADLDGDGDVDQLDFAVWQRCANGAARDPQEGCDG